MRSHLADVIVIGAGPAGTVAACYLAEQGHKVSMIEKAVFPRFTIGESLLPISMDHWAEAGLLNALEKQNYAVKRGARFVQNGESVDFLFSEGFTNGSTWTWQVPRANFDDVLAQEVQAKGVEIHFGHLITAVEFNTEKGHRILSYINGEEHEHRCQFIIDASGAAGVLANAKGVAPERAANGRMSIFAHVRETEAHRSKYKDPMQITFEVLAKDLWYWVIPFSNGITSLGFVGDQRHFINDKDQFGTLINSTSLFQDRFEDLDVVLPPKAVADFTYRSPHLWGDGHVIVGDCAGFLDPVFSSGVAFATGSGLRAAKLVHRQLQGIVVDWEKEYEVPVREGADVFRTYIDSWYSGELVRIFFSPVLQQNIKRKIVSVLAGYVWDKGNPFVTRHSTILKTLDHVAAM